MPSRAPAALLVAGLALGGLGLYRVVLPRLWSTAAAAPVTPELEPLQAPLEPPERVEVTRGGRRFVIEKTFSYEISGEVLSATTYDLTWTSDFFDVDVGLIWGPRRAEMKERYSFSQMGRFLFYRTDQPVTQQDLAEVGRHVSNNHLIPAEGRSHLASALRWIRTGDLVRIRGALVRVIDDSKTEVATSSLVRDDTGDGACEIIWVDELQVGSRVFR